MIAGVLCAVLTAGCENRIDGGPVPQRALSLPQVLPSAEQVAQAVGNRLDATGPPLVGGIALLPNGFRDAEDVSPLDCLGAATPLMRVVYEKGGVRQVALQDFSRYGEGLTVSSAHTGVVEFGSEAEASRMFESFAAQWRSCADTRVSVHVTPRSSLDWTITDVRESDGILSTTVLNGESDRDPAFPTEHAVGQVANYLIDVDVAVTDGDPNRRVASGRAADLVRKIRGNINRAR
ncbi:MAG: sensor domain-containing protein [Mycobacterium sp.]|nr:sensor domain-containing protein [Mycobacterium sp.]